MTPADQTDAMRDEPELRKRVAQAICKKDHRIGYDRKTLWEVYINTFYQMADAAITAMDLPALLAAAREEGAARGFREGMIAGRSIVELKYDWNLDTVRQDLLLQFDMETPPALRNPDTEEGET